MKILVLNEDFPPVAEGGAGRVAYNLAREMQKRGHTLHILTTVQEKGQAGESEYEGLKVTRRYSSYPMRFQNFVGLWNPPAVREVKRVIAEFKPDVVHAHNVHTFLSYRSLAIAKRSGARVVITYHDTMAISNANRQSGAADAQVARERGVRNTVVRRLLARHIDCSAAISESLAKVLRANDIAVSRVIHNGLETKSWGVSPEIVTKFKKQHRLGDKVVLFGGRLSAKKGAYVAVDALAEIARTVPGVQLLIIGTKNEVAKKMLERARTHGVEEKIVFTGHISGEDLRAAYHASSVVAVLSQYLDSLPTIVLEAHACGKPVVATSLGGAPEIVKDGVTGYIVNPFDASQVAEKAADLLKNQEKAEQFGLAGAELIARDFTLEGQASAYEALYKKENR